MPKQMCGPKKWRSRRSIWFLPRKFQGLATVFRRSAVAPRAGALGGLADRRQAALARRAQPCRAGLPIPNGLRVLLQDRLAGGVSRPAALCGDRRAAAHLRDRLGDRAAGAAAAIAASAAGAAVAQRGAVTGCPRAEAAVTRRPRRSTPASPAALRLCHAVGLLTRLRVGRWCRIDAALALLTPNDRDAEIPTLMSAVTAELVTINSGSTADLIKLTAAGLEACRAAAQPRQLDDVMSPEYWENRAAEARARADAARDAEAKDFMLNIASTHAAIAARVRAWRTPRSSRRAFSSWPT